MKVLFTSTHLTSFISQDLSLLRKHFDVDHLITKGFGAPFKIFRAIKNADVTFTWFASVYAFATVLLGKLTRRKSIIVVGGVDASKYPEIGYGIWSTPWKAVLVKHAMRNAHKLLAVDPFLRGQIVRLAEYDGQNIECIPTGYDSALWFASGIKEPFVLTVAACETENRMKAKGLDVLFDVASEMSDRRFVVIGLAGSLGEKARGNAPLNVEVIPYIEREQLLQYYQRAMVYCQPSYAEGLPNSLCEAMLCECVPVGTNVGGIPTAIGDVGFLVDYGDISQLVECLKKALRAPRSVGEKARNRIKQNFSLKRREESLLRILKDAVGEAAA
ncbi:MAG: glycosyltransferase family 4 protein [Ignavibacteria bacterium]|nr:glycosyltransferase family 4 protein [Ignavibacteria bacterium]